MWYEEVFEMVWYKLTAKGDFELSSSMDSDFSFWIFQYPVKCLSQEQFHRAHSSIVQVTNLIENAFFL